MQFSTFATYFNGEPRIHLQATYTRAPPTPRINDVDRKGLIDGGHLHKYGVVEGAEDARIMGLIGGDMTLPGTDPLEAAHVT